MKQNVYLIFGLLIITVAFISGCNFIISDESEVTEVVSQVEDRTPKTESAGPGGCIGGECSTYCERNQAECEKWCEENPELCSTLLGKTGREQFTRGISQQECQQNPQKCLEFCEKNPGVCPEEHVKSLRSGIGGLLDVMSITGPDGCRGPACQQYCQQKMEACQNWCLENPDATLCKILSGELTPGGGMGGFPGMTEEVQPVEPPATTITFAKSVNVISDAFTEQDILKAKQLSANMITIWPARQVKNDEFTFTPERIAGMINTAHKNGLQVELRSSFGGEQIQNFEKFKTNSLKHVAEYAKFAE
ncbi:hypothetical protein HYV83_01185, partial [Candidatus Woesearchaeota archaeon]|nr:hypothetical protein [Candidatus Woesearchaeota archaeon]